MKDTCYLYGHAGISTRRRWAPSTNLQHTDKRVSIDGLHDLCGNRAMVKYMYISIKDSRVQL